MINPTAAFLAVLIYVVAVVSLSSPAPLSAAAALAVATGVSLAGGVRPLKALLWALPLGGALAFVLPFVTPGGRPLLSLPFGSWTLTVSSAGLIRGYALFLRLLAAATLMVALRARLGISALLAALQGLRVPAIFVSLAAFTLRYTEVLAGESRRMLVARYARGFGRDRRGFPSLRSTATYAQLIGVLLLRAKERSERVHLAMLSRGYRVDAAGHGSTRPPLVASPGDVAALTASLLVATALTLWDRSL